MRELAKQLEELRPRARDLARRLRVHGGWREIQIAAELERFASVGEMPAKVGDDDG